MARNRLVLVAVALVVALGAVLVLGSYLYWVADGRPRSPAAFRDLVAATGLTVDWTNNGPRGGDGVVDTACGERAVAVDEVDDELWVRWDGRRERITPIVIDEFLRCAAGSG